jgi:hypothetical protein
MPSIESKSGAGRSASTGGAGSALFVEESRLLAGVIQRGETECRKTTGNKIHPFVGPPDAQNAQASFDKHRHQHDLPEEPWIVDRKAGGAVRSVFGPGPKSRKKPRCWKIEQTEQRVEEEEERRKTMAEKRGSGHRRKEEKRPAFAPSAGQSELESKVSHVPESVDSHEGVGSFQSRHCERDRQRWRAPGLRPALVFRIHTEKVLRHSAGKAEFLFQSMLGDQESRLGPFVFSKRPPLRNNVDEPLRRIEPVFRSVHD